jgi:hypothetical protein
VHCTISQSQNTDPGWMYRHMHPHPYPPRHPTTSQTHQKRPMNMRIYTSATTAPPLPCQSKTQPTSCSGILFMACSPEAVQQRAECTKKMATNVWICVSTTTATSFSFLTPNVDQTDVPAPSSCRAASRPSNDELNTQKNGHKHADLHARRLCLFPYSILASGSHAIQVRFLHYLVPIYS